MAKCQLSELVEHFFAVTNRIRDELEKSLEKMRKDRDDCLQRESVMISAIMHTIGDTAATGTISYAELRLRLGRFVDEWEQPQDRVNKAADTDTHTDE